MASRQTRFRVGMKMRDSISILAVTALAASCATSRAAVPSHAAVAQAAQKEQSSQPEVAASSLVDHAGDSTQTAVEVPADAPNGGIDFENEWIYHQVGRFRRSGGGTGSLNGRRYDVIDVETPMGGKYKFFFDITESWKNWRK